MKICLCSILNRPHQYILAKFPSTVHFRSGVSHPFLCDPPIAIHNGSSGEELLRIM